MAHSLQFNEWAISVRTMDNEHEHLQLGVEGWRLTCSICYTVRLLINGYLYCDMCDSELVESFKGVTTNAE